MTFNGERLRQLRTAKLWSKLELARRLGVSDPQVGRWEEGKATPRGAMVKKLGRVLGCAVSELSVEEAVTV